MRRFKVFQEMFTRSFLLLSIVGGSTFGAGVCPGTSCDGPAELPRTYIDTSFATNFPTNFAGYITKTVCASGCNYSSFQTALNNIRADGGETNGEIIRLGAGQTFVGNFIFPLYHMAPGKWVFIRTDTADSNLPSEGNRIDLTYAPTLAKIYTPNSGPTVEFAGAANHYWFMGVEIGAVSNVTVNFELIMAGRGSEVNASDLPEHIVVDRCYVHGTPTGAFKRGFQTNGKYQSAINSYFSDFHVDGQDAQAICGWNGPGPFKVVNNFLAGAGENIMYGGGYGPIPGVIPSDIEIRFNHFFKPLSWMAGDPSYAGIPWTIKNLLEFKNAQRVLVEGNVLEQNWKWAQAGYGILLTPKDVAPGMPQSVNADITIRYNVLRRTGSGFSIGSNNNTLINSAPTRISIHDNLLSDISSTWAGAGVGAADGVAFLLINGSPSNVLLPPIDLYIDHNTVFHDGLMMVLGDNPATPMPRFTFTNNLLPHNAFGIKGSGGGIGSGSLNIYMTNPVFLNNIIEGLPSGISPSQYPSGNFFPASWAAVDFVNFAASDYHLAPTSPYKNAGTDGKDVGANIDSVITHTCYAVSGIPGGACVAIPAPPPSVGPPSTNPPPATGVTPISTPVARPNPWRADRHSSPAITFDQLPVGGALKIFTASGHLVKEMSISSASMTWDLTNASGQRVASGVYLYLVTDGAGQKVRGKVAIIK